MGDIHGMGGILACYSLASTTATPLQKHTSQSIMRQSLQALTTGNYEHACKDGQRKSSQTARGSTWGGSYASSIWSSSAHPCSRSSAALPVPAEACMKSLQRPTSGCERERERERKREAERRHHQHSPCNGQSSQDVEPTQGM